MKKSEIETAVYRLTPYEKLWLDILGKSILLVGFNPETNELLTLFAKEKREAVERALRTLEAREEKAIRLRFGLHKSPDSSECYRCHTFKEIGQQFFFTSERGHQILKRALKRLRHPSRRFYFSKVIFLDQLIELEQERQLLCQRIKQQNQEREQWQRLAVQEGLGRNKKESGVNPQLIDLLCQPVNDVLEISTRLNNCLRRADIRLVGELIQWSERDLLRLKNFGRRCLNEIKEALTKKGLTLEMSLSEEVVTYIQQHREFIFCPGER